MKTFRLSRKVQIILVTIFVIVAGVIIVGSVSNNEVFAASCPDCGKTYTKVKVVNIDSTYHGWYYYCTTCQREGSIYARYPHSPDAENCAYCGNFYDIGSGGDSSGHTCSNFTTHYEYAQKVPSNDEVHERYFVCDTCGLSWYDCDLVHDGGNHYNGGECTLCGYQYQRHAQSTQKTYNKTDSTHTEVYKCTDSDCNATYEGETEYHDGATHANGGKCTVCGYQYETHGKSTTVDYYNQTATTHTPVYYCTESGCSTTYTGTSEKHKGATHENGGKCTVCEYQYETHGQANEPYDYKKTEDGTGHIPIYACTLEGCTATYEGGEEPHNNETWKDNEDGTHSSTCTKCGLVTTEPHNNEAWNDNEDGTHSSTCTKCDAVTTEPHNNEAWNDNEDGTHSSTCTKCDAVTTEEHNYEDGKCKECGADEPEIYIDPGEYEILEAYITQIQPETTVSIFKNNLATNAEEINIYNLNNELLKDTDIIGTGMKLKLKKGTQVKNFTLIVRGDVNGDGTAKMADILIINQYRLNKRSLEEIYLIAGDVTGDGKVDFFDIIKINRYKLHKITKL